MRPLALSPARRFLAYHLLWKHKSFALNKDALARGLSLDAYRWSLARVTPGVIVWSTLPIYSEWVPASQCARSGRGSARGRPPVRVSAAPAGVRVCCVRVCVCVCARARARAWSVMIWHGHVAEDGRGRVRPCMPTARAWCASSLPRAGRPCSPRPAL